MTDLARSMSGVRYLLRAVSGCGEEGGGAEARSRDAIAPPQQVCPATMTVVRKNLE